MNLIVTHLGISDCLFLFTESNELKLREWLRERYEQAVDTLIDHLRHESSSVKVHCPWSYNISYIRAIHTHPLIHRYIDTPLHWYTVTLVHRYIGTPLHWYTVTSIHRYIDTPLHWYTVTLVHRYIGTPLHWYTATLSSWRYCTSNMIAKFSFCLLFYFDC